MAIEATRMFDVTLRSRGLQTALSSYLATLMAAVILLLGDDAAALDHLNMPALTRLVYSGAQVR
jgi:hypothetical protein